MAPTWRLIDASKRLCDLLRAAETEGPQLISDPDVATAVVVTFSEYNLLVARAGKTLARPLLVAPEHPGAHTDRATGARGRKSLSPQPC